MPLPPVDFQYLRDSLLELLNIPSPTGYTHLATEFVRAAFDAFPEITISHTRKGSLFAKWAGMSPQLPRGITAHVDTLGAMVKEIKPNGRLKLTKIGGFAWNSVEGEGCTVFTRNDGVVRGSILLTKASSHVYGNQVNELKRTDETMEVRLDARVDSLDEVHNLGVDVGDFVAFEPRVEVNNDFIRSRHLDDKAGVACILAAVKAIHDSGLKPARDTCLLISNYEEVGHGAASGMPSSIAELLAVDMAAVGEGQNSDEFHATLCVKDSGGPYHHGLNQHLRQVADQYNIEYKVDVYPYYKSDGEAYWVAGGDVAVALIGPGVDASHNYERTHMDALLITTKWIVAYLLSE